MPVRRTKKRAFAIAVLVVALTVAAGAATAPAMVDTDQSPDAVSVVAAGELEDGDTVRIVMDESLSAPVTARLCNTDSRIGDDGACAAPVTATGDDGRLEVTLPIELGQIGSSPYAYCPSVPDFNDAAATCSIVVERDGESFVAAQVVADPEAELQQTVSVEVSRVDDTEPPTIGGGTGTAPPVRPTTDTLPAPRDVPLVPAAQPGGGATKIAGDTLATTGPSLTLILAALGVALVDLGWLLWSATKQRKSSIGV